MAANPVIAAKLRKLRIMFARIERYEPSMSNQWRNDVATELDRAIRSIDIHVDTAEKVRALNQSQHRGD